ncbi:MAG: threonine ammonia-lyase [Gammaproteobacteria bacterium]|jgi:threonine dehydratase|nr:threonine ammonia-lyase [Gammaproteobacteria bacterium]MDP6537570.1 threonine ammonia-lyase [Gammaproteobacteria bacterium]MDP6733809.1 threonine ammonia-lyase [Gammaproteobacteria bacterium]HAJ76593.1 threonine ammonia-lyase [Gammaproteobacteria bacterium]|tara:strand:+ start:231 stop:1448 length:1218 start_codon:yes stop_codon:yes gene_type:complete
MSISFADIQAAADRIGSRLIDTRFEQSRTLSSILSTEILLKFENLQFTASFKERGALNKLLQLSHEQKISGVIAMSAGNHAKAVAYHAQCLGIPATIVMPKNTPNVKVEDTRNFKARVILEGSSLDEAADYAHSLASEEQLVFVHPYNDEQIIAGQGTIALEMLAAHPELDAIAVPIGGGGLIAGIATAAKAINPDIKIVGVEVSTFPGAYNAVHKVQEQLADSGITTIAEGIAVKQPGELTLPIIEQLVDEIVVVDEETIEEAIDLLITIEKTVVEGAGAVALAAILATPQLFQHLKTAVVLSGANIDSRILASVLMRRLVRKGRIVRYLVKISGSPGTLSDVTAMIGELGGNILEVSHQRMFAALPVKEADLYITVETRDKEQAEAILKQLQANGYLAELIQA